MEDCSTDERLQQETLCHRLWTDEYVEHPEMLMRLAVPVHIWNTVLVDRTALTIGVIIINAVCLSVTVWAPGLLDQLLFVHYSVDKTRKQR